VLVDLQSSRTKFDLEQCERDLCWSPAVAASLKTLTIKFPRNAKRETAFFACVTDREL